MRHQNTVFHGLLKHVPWPAFDRLVEHHRADAGVRRLPTKSQFLALLYGQLAGASSLRRNSWNTPPANSRTNSRPRMSIWFCVQRRSALSAV